MRTIDEYRAMPKAELHIHLDGSVRPATIDELAREVGLVPHDAPPGFAAERVLVTERAGLLEALAGFDILLPILQTPQRLRRVTAELVEDLAAEGVTYAELRFAPRLFTDEGLTSDAVLGHTAEAAAEAAEATGTKAPLIACLMGGRDPEWNADIVDAALDGRGDGVVAVDLAGPVDGRTPEWVDAHAYLFAKARDAGLRVTIHAGEAEPPDAIRTALERYGAERIGHGTTLVADEALLAEVAERGIPVESCPRSNYWTRTAAEMPRLSDHPVGAVLRAGAVVCLNTDDRSLFANDLSSELAVTQEALELTDAEVDRLIANGWAAAFAAPTRPSR
ncbi:MAG TPA: adenosine deaminase [Egibacteraceae bacterium]|nr:adenosine deaminase [Egibacteraceae bacterium]